MEEEIFRGLITKNIDDAKIILTGVPFDKNASIGKGASEEPHVMRELSKSFPPLTKDGFEIENCKIFDNGDIAQKSNESIEKYFIRLQKEAYKVMEKNKFPLFVGGDHSIAIATERAFFDYCKKVNKKPAIIHIDAHPDICDEYEDSKYSHACPNRRSIDYGYDTKDIVMIGIRGYESQEVKYFAEHPELKVFNATYILNNGIKKILKTLKQKFANDDYLVYLSYDIDANDPCFAPGTGTPEAFGPSSLTILEIVKYIITNLPVGAMDLVEISPLIDVNNVTTWLGLKTLYEVFYLLSNKK